MNEERRTGLIGALILSALIGGAVAWWLKPCAANNGINAAMVEVRIDTIEHVVMQPAIRVRAAGVVQIDTVLQHDTVIETHPFVASLDTTIHNDTLHVAYRFPLNQFSVVLMQAPDTVQLQFRTITLTNTTYEQRAWWLDALTHVGAAALGYTVGTVAQ